MLELDLNSKKYRFLCINARKFSWAWGIIELFAVSIMALLIVVFLVRWDDTLGKLGRVEPEPEPESKSEPEVQSEPQTTAESPAAEPESTTEAKTYSEPEAESESEPESEPETFAEEDVLGKNPERKAKIMWGVALFLLLIFGVFDILLLHGIKVKNHRYLYPHLITQVIAMLLTLGMAIFAGIAVFSLAETKETKNIWIINLVGLYFSLALNFYVFWIGLKTVQFLRDWQMAYQSEMSSVYSSRASSAADLVPVKRY